MAKLLNRRTFLRGAGGVCVGLPFLHAMQGHAAPGDGPKRLVIFWTGNGAVHNEFASGTENNFTLGATNMPLMPHKDDLLFIKGVDLESSFNGPGDNAHQRCFPHALTGTEMVPTGGGNLSETGGDISIDQYIANQVGAQTRFSFLGFGVKSIQNGGAGPFNTVSFSGPAQPVPVNDDPTSNFDRLFADLTADQGELARIRAQRHSVLDVVREDAGRVKARLGSEDRIRLDTHLDSLREVEKVIDTTTNLGGACSVPPAPPVFPDTHDNDSYPAVGQAQMDMLAMALACDLTRSSVMQWNHALGGDLTFSWLGHNESFHDISHKGDGNAQGNQQKIEINTWYAEQFAYFIDLLKAMPEGNCTVFDNTVILWARELSRGNAHSRRDMHYVLSGGSYFRTGRYLNYGGDPHNNLLVSLANAVGEPISTFGNPAYCTGPLANLL